MPTSSAGSLGLRALSCFLSHFATVLTTDSGPRHIANAAGVPVVFVRNVWSNAVETGVYVDTRPTSAAPRTMPIAATDPRSSPPWTPNRPPRK